MEIPICAGTSSFLQFSDAHLHIIAIIKVSQHGLGQVLESNPSPSPFLHQFPMIFFFSSRRRLARCCRGTAELLPWLLDIGGRTTRFSHSPASHRLSPDFPTTVFCSPQSDSAFLMWQTFHQLNFYYDLGSIFQIIFHCVYHPLFFLAPTDYHLFLRLSQACLPPAICCRCRRILSPWCSCVFCPILTNPPPGSSCLSS